MAKEQTVNCDDLFDSTAEKIKGLNTDIDKTIQELAKRVEQGGVPRNKVARTVVKELTARVVLALHNENSLLDVYKSQIQTTSF